MAIFGSYIGKERTLLGESVNVILLDTFVAVVAGLIIFPACFTFNVEVNAGPSLLFDTMATVFNHMDGGRWWGALFFLFMVFAALSTVLAVCENILACVRELTGWGRIKGCLICGIGVFLLALTTVSSLSAGNIVKGLLSCMLGVSLAFVGIDKLSAYTRYTMGMHDLAAGFNLVPLLIGVFAVSQIMERAAEQKFAKPKEKVEAAKTEKVRGFGLSFKEFGVQMKNAIPAAIIGLAIGILPGIGGNDLSRRDLHDAKPYRYKHLCLVIFT